MECAIFDERQLLEKNSQSLDYPYVSCIVSLVSQYICKHTIHRYGYFLNNTQFYASKLMRTVSSNNEAPESTRVKKN